MNYQTTSPARSTGVKHGFLMSEAIALIVVHHFRSIYSLLVVII